MRRLALACCLPILTQCAPVPLEQAETQCAYRAAGGGGGTGNVAVGVSTGDGFIGAGNGGVAIGVGTGGIGPGVGVGLGLGNGFGTWPRVDAETVYVNCVRDATGQDPTLSMSAALKRAAGG